MKTDTQKTKVVFRIWPKSKGGDVIAIFPRDVGTYDPSTCSSYMHVGQHASCRPHSLTSLRLAKPAEYKELASELRGRGYRLDIRTRCTRSDYKERQNQIGSIKK